MKKADEPNTICAVHNKIISIFEEQYPDKEGEYVPDYIIEIYLLVYQAKKMGQKMEARLSKYKKGIERLGFTRKDNKNGKKRSSSSRNTEKKNKKNKSRSK